MKRSKTTRAVESTVRIGEGYHNRQAILEAAK